MEKKYSKEILKILEAVGNSLVNNETQEIKLFKNHRGKYLMTKTESVNVEFQN